jgi:hypothetical protein
MKLQHAFVLHRIAAVAGALLLAGPAAGAGAAARAACAPRPAAGDLPSQSTDALSVSLDAAQPVGLANWDVRWWQRHRVWITLDASNSGDAAVQVLPQMVLDLRADGGAALAQFGLPLSVAPHAHATQRLSIYIPDDAKTLGVRIVAAAPTRPVAVAFSLECSDARFDLGQFDPRVAALFDEATKTYFNGFVDPLSDPQAAFETLRLLASGAQDGDDVAWALRGLMQVVHDDHGFVVGPGQALPARRTLATRDPELALRPDGIAVLRLHALESGAGAATQAWARALHEGIAALAARRPRAWIVDLRDHDADSPWPAFAALGTLLDGPAVGAFTSRVGQQEWIVERGSARVAGGPAQVDLESPPEPAFHGPVAVLIGPNTRNAGEDVTVALRGRPHTRFFGAPTAGFPILGVQVHTLSDGTRLGVLETRDADRTGVVHRLPVEPDTRLPDAVSLAATPQPVLDWIDAENASSAGSR